LSHDGATEDFADFAKDVFRRDAELAMTRSAFEKRLGRFLIEHARVDRAIVQLAEREQRRERDAAVSSAKRRMRQQCEKKRGDFVGKRRIRFAPKSGDLRPLNGVDQSELRFDDAGMGLRAAELRADRAMKIDEILNRQIANAAVSR
jgi:hypothetical protein